MSFPWSLPSATFLPERQSLGGLGPWAGHLPFACDLIAALRPSLLVELGVFYGESYFGFCQACEESSVRCACFGVDTWKGDPHGGYYSDEVYENVKEYNDSHYGRSSTLLRTTFDDSLEQFSDNSIDLLHIDGHHSEESARHDFEAWLPKVRPGGIVLMHDIAVRSRDFGVWRVWEEASRQFPAFAFTHSSGLGVLRKPGGGEPPAWLGALFSADAAAQNQIAGYYYACADRLRLRAELSELRKKVETPGQCAVQVFYSRDGVYTPENSRTRIIDSAVWQRVRLALPDGVGDQSLRFDPADRPGIIEISEMLIRDAEDATVLWQWNAVQPHPQLAAGGTGRVLMSKSTLMIASDGFDPQVMLPGLSGEPFQRPLEFEAFLRVTPCMECGVMLASGNCATGNVPQISCLPGELRAQFGALRDSLVDAVREETAASLRGRAAEEVRSVGARIDELPQSVPDGQLSREQRLAAEIERLQTTIGRMEADATDVGRRRAIETSWLSQLTRPLRYLRRTKTSEPTAAISRKPH